MNSGIVISVNLPGRLEGAIKHVSTQTYSVKVFTKEQKILTLTKDILHTDRQPTKCSRKINITPSIVALWVRSECPYWMQPKFWKNFSKTEKIQAFVNRFDEGYGVSYE